MTTAFRCFKAETFAEVNPTALAGQHRGFFLAAHAPSVLVQLNAQYNPLSREAKQVDEEELFEALREPLPDKVTFAILRGSTGSGKSHLIRWLYFKLEAEKLENVKLLLIRRDETNLREIIRKIVELAADDPGELLTEIREKLQAREELNDAGKRNLLLDELARAVDPNNFPKGAFDPYVGLTDSREIDARKTAVRLLPAFFRDEAYRAHLSAAEGVVDELVRLTVGQRNGNQLRDRPREFVSGDFDLPDQLVFGAGGNDPRANNAPAAVNLAQYLKKDLRMRAQAAAYVNTRLKPCTDRLLNLDGVNLLEVFTEVRRRIQKAGLRLVLLIEDLADVEYMHRQVLEALIADPSPELCPLASVVGVSDGFSAAIPDNIRDRAAPHIYSLDVQHGSPNYLNEFTARYLDALRTPLKDLEDRGGRTAPSACYNCEFKGKCHDAFGAVGTGDAAVGLFPFNTNALQVMHRKAHTRDQDKSDFNPRQFLAGLLVPALIKEADSFAAKRYPTQVLRQQFVDAAQSPGLISTMDGKYGVGRGNQAETLEAIWGRSLPDAVYEAFGLTPAKKSPPVVVPTANVPPVSPVVPVVPPVPEGPIAPPGNTLLTDPGADTLRTAISELDHYHQGAKVGQNTMTLLRTIVRSAVVSRIEWNRLFMEEKDWAGSNADEFPHAYVNLEENGMMIAAGGPEGRRLVIPRKYNDRQDLDPVVGLQGLLLAHHYKGWDFEHATQKGLYYLRHALPLVDRLAGEVANRLNRLFAPPGVDMPAAGLELLAVAARLQGDLPPDADDPTLIAALVAERTDWNTNEKDPNRNWDKLREAFGNYFAKLRKPVISALNCAKGNDGKAVVLDADRLLAAVARWRGRHGKPGEPLPRGQIHQHWTPLAEARRAVDQHLAPAVKVEAEAWVEWVTDVDQQLEGAEPSKLLEAGGSFCAESAAVYRCSFKGEDLDLHKNRSSSLALLRTHDRQDRTIDRNQLARLEREFEGVLEAQGGVDGPARPSAFEEALAQAREVSKAYNDAPYALDQLLHLLGRCRANAAWVKARNAWWNYTLVLAAAVKQTTAALRTEGGSDLTATQKKVGELLTQIETDAKAVQGVLQ
jgi:hypothetical protein